MIEKTNSLIHDARDCWKRAAIAGDAQAMALFERQGRARIAKLERCLAAFRDTFGRGYRLNAPAIKVEA